MRGSGRMSTAANALPSASSAATVRAEKPHIGRSGVPFMKRMTSCSVIASWIASRIGFSVSAHAGPRFGSGFEGQGVDRAADLGAEDRVDAAVLLDPAHARELRGHDRGAEVIAAAGQVHDLGPAPGIAASMRCLSSSVVGIATEPSDVRPARYTS